MISIFQLGNPVLAADSNDNVLVQMFAWWNSAIKDPNGFTEQAFRHYYTEDAAIVINGSERVRGIKPMVEHFKRIQQRTESVEIVLPFEEGFESGNRIFTYHLIHARENGVDSLSHVMGYAIIENGKIAFVDFLAYEPPTANETTANTN
jgi:ketosteroid isomerase-like protein